MRRRKWWRRDETGKRQRDHRTCPRVELLEARCVLSYTVTDLGLLPGGTFSIATAINSHGTIVGWGDTTVNSVQDTHAFAYSNGTMTDLGTLVGNAGNSRAFGINSAGDVVGDSTSASSTGSKHSFLLPSGGIMRDLRSLEWTPQDDPGESTANAVNESRQVVGRSTFPGDTYRYFHAIYSDGSGSTTPTDLGTANGGDGSEAKAIDNATTPREVGWSQDFPYTHGTTTDHHFHAVRWLGSSQSSLSDLGTVGTGNESHAWGINASHTVCGDSAVDVNINYGSYPPHAFLRDSSGMFTQLDAGVTWSPQSRAVGINNASPVQVVGIWGTSASGEFTNTDGFVWDSVNGFQKLKDLFGASNTLWSGPVPYDISDSGTVVGQGKINGGLHAFLAVPSTGPSTSGSSKPPTVIDPSAMDALPRTSPPSSPDAPVLAVNWPQSSAALVQSAAASTDTGQGTESAGTASPLYTTPWATDEWFVSREMELMGAPTEVDSSLLQAPLR